MQLLSPSALDTGIQYTNPVKSTQQMNLIKTAYCIAMCILAASCIKDPPLNPEADIETFTVNPGQITSSTFIDHANNRILLYLKPSAYETGIAPVITISEGASIAPASGDSIHFDSTGITQYVVTSQSRAYTKTYVVQVVNIGTWAWDFEWWGENDKDHYQYPLESDSSILWSSGNPGVALGGVPANPSAYPLKATTDKYSGTYAAELITLPGTTLSGLVGIKLFAGSLFLGNFDSKNAFVAPLKATQFGQPYIGKAARFRGYYKYQPGPNYQDKSGNIVPGVTDSCSIYAVLYHGTTRLDGTDILTSDRIIATAMLPDGSARGNFTLFDIPFTYKPGATTTGNLMMAIVASSSKDGDSYKGAINSRLVLDSVSIIHQ
ncbi:MAG: PCMD domain-containing protein [Chitinophagaceae bacterium]